MRNKNTKRTNDTKSTSVVSRRPASSTPLVLQDRNILVSQNPESSVSQSLGSLTSQAVNSMGDFDQIQTELLIYIFSLLSVPDLLNLASVSNPIKQFSENPDIWTNQYNRALSIASSEAAEIFKPKNNNNDNFKLLCKEMFLYQSKNFKKQKPTVLTDKSCFTFENEGSSIRTKFLILGDSSDRKGQFVKHAADKMSSRFATAGVPFLVKSIDKQGHPFRIMLYDTSGESYRADMATRHTSKNTSCAIVLFNADKESEKDFSSIKKWVNKAKERFGSNAVIVIVGICNPGDSNASRKLVKLQTYAERMLKVPSELCSIVSINNSSKIENIVSKGLDEVIKRYQLFSKDEEASAEQEKRCLVM